MSEQPHETSDVDLVGRKLGDYQILRRIGRGGMAEVYLAEQESLGRKVAIKVLRSDLTSDENYVRRFQNEARAVASLVHANIVQIYEVGHIDGVRFLAQEYVPGTTLKQVVTKNGPLDVPMGISVLRQVAAALNRASQQKMVHRDIKPENILLTQDGEAKVADFGLARVAERGNLELTQDGMTMGTPLYMSPEQVEGKPLDPRSDIYSCGVMAYYMFVGHPPFEGDSPLNVAIQHLQKEPPSLVNERPDFPLELSQIVDKMLAKKLENRYGSAAELLKDLRPLQLRYGGFDSNVDERFSIEADDHTLPMNQLDATIQLQSVMATQAMMIQKRQRSWFLPLLLSICFATGGLAAFATWEGPILANNQTSPSIKKEETASQQFMSALNAGEDTIEAALKAVWENHPPEESENNRYWMLLAKENLANFYFDQGRVPEARETFDYLANLESDEEFRVKGLAGQIKIENSEGKVPSNQLHTIWALRIFYLDAKLRAEIEQIAEKAGVREGLDKEFESQLNDSLSE